MKQKKLTIYDIKYLISGSDSHFFDRSTMKGFEQTLKDFKVRYSPTGRIFLYAPIKLHGKVIGYTFREFTPQDNKLHTILVFSSNIHQKFYDIQSYISLN